MNSKDCIFCYGKMENHDTWCQLYEENAAMIPTASTAALQPISGLVGPKDLSVELYREYVDPKGNVYRISNPVALYYRDGGSTHRIVDSDGVTHCVAFPSGYGGAQITLRWKNRDSSQPVGF